MGICIVQAASKTSGLSGSVNSNSSVLIIDALPEVSQRSKRIVAV